ncbi:hypothetical protein K461DRAFT_319867 [Myriangium duriaei CBS 260.36]|uniref:Uncharacterized protein n=1 Tax=Myriangium duriaei CBS 260.36 TaxID=1168546 RepID=A0A9P4J988_9PEZI|nr:hypothetical protein K461DRAFT_319867 [Myriangium duriaei CBS 260.36]
MVHAPSDSNSEAGNSDASSRISHLRDRLALVDQKLGIHNDRYSETGSSSYQSRHDETSKEVRLSNEIAEIKHKIDRKRAETLTQRAEFGSRLAPVVEGFRSEYNGPSVMVEVTSPGVNVNIFDGSKLPPAYPPPGFPYGPPPPEYFVPGPPPEHGYLPPGPPMGYLPQGYHEPTYPSHGLPPQGYPPAGPPSSAHHPSGPPESSYYQPSHTSSNHRPSSHAPSSYHTPSRAPSDYRAGSHASSRRR